MLRKKSLLHDLYILYRGFYMFGIYIMRHILYVLFVNLLCLRNDEWLFLNISRIFFKDLILHVVSLQCLTLSGIITTSKCSKCAMRQQPNDRNKLETTRGQYTVITIDSHLYLCQLLNYLKRCE